jgi:hypothetical protein
MLLAAGPPSRPVAEFCLCTDALLGDKTTVQNHLTFLLVDTHATLSRVSDTHFSLVTKKSMDIHLFGTGME